VAAPLLRRFPGALLVASPTLLDPNFYRSVVLLMAHNDEGAIGVVLDRPLDLTAAEYVEEWESMLTPPSRVYEGGPVQRETAIGVARRTGFGPSESWEPVLGSLGFVDLGKTPADFPGVEDLRVFSGYAGWGPDQLDLEIAIGSWFPVEASVDDVFDPVPHTLWGRVLKRQDNGLALYANYPDDPRDN
jgi:putative transcriptional regulator